MRHLVELLMCGADQRRLEQDGLLDSKELNSAYGVADHESLIENTKEAVRKLKEAGQVPA